MGSDYGSTVNDVVLNLAYKVSILYGDQIVSSMTRIRMTTETSEIFNFVDLDLEPGTQYTVKAFVQNAVGEGNALEGAFTTDAGVSEVPMTTTPVWTSTQSLVLSWEAPADGGAVITTYVVTVGVGSTAVSTARLDSNSTMYVVDPTTLRRVFQGGDEITYSVRADNTGGEGVMSIGTFILLDIPGTPTSVTATGIGTNTVRVTVSAPDNDGYGRKATDTTTYGSIVDEVALEFGYKVSILYGDQIVSSMTRIRMTTETSEIFNFVDLDLELGTQYTVKASAQNAVGEGNTRQEKFMTGGTSPTDRARLRLRAYLGGAVR